MFLANEEILVKKKLGNNLYIVFTLIVILNMLRSYIYMFRVSAMELLESFREILLCSRKGTKIIGSR